MAPTPRPAPGDTTALLAWVDSQLDRIDDDLAWDDNADIDPEPDLAEPTAAHASRQLEDDLAAFLGRQQTTEAPRFERRQRRLERQSWAPEDLPPLHCPPGYVRDQVGRWRYEATGGYVPGARDVTLRRLVRPPRCACGAHVLFTATAVETTDELAWVPAVAQGCRLSWREAGDRAFAVELRDWLGRADVALGVAAPELCADRLLDLQRVAERAAVAAPTVSAYLSRGQFPAPVTRLARTPVWSAPIVDQWRTGAWSRLRHSA